MGGFVQNTPSVPCGKLLMGPRVKPEGDDGGWREFSEQSRKHGVIPAKAGIQRGQSCPHESLARDGRRALDSQSSWE